MNVSLAFKEMATKKYEFNSRERLMVIIGAGIIIFAIIMYSSTSEVSVEPVLPSSSMLNTAKQGAVPSGTPSTSVTSMDKPIRDPFAKAPEVNSQRTAPDMGGPILHNNVPNAIPGMAPSMIPQSTTDNGIPAKDFKLTGIVSGGNRQFAVIMSGGKSKSYGIQDNVGAYRIIAINEDDIVLKNNDNRIVLRLESVSQKGR